MRGKKTNPHFLSEFIESCVENGLTTTEEMLAKAKQNVADIDESIRSIEKLKAMRSELLGVIETFEKPVKTSKVEEVRALSFFKIKQPKICKYICDALKGSPTPIDSLNAYPKEDIMFCIKQLLEHKIIYKSASLVLRGESFEDYLKFVLKD